MSNQYVIHSARRTLQVLLVFGKPPFRFSLAELVQATHLEKNQLYRSLKTLESVGFLAVGGDGRFELTKVVNVLGAASARGRSSSLVAVATPYLDDLAARSGESVNLGALAGDQVICVDYRESASMVRLMLSVGQAGMLHAGAVPKAILAYLPDSEREQYLARLPSLPRYTNLTLLDVAALRADLAATRARGYSISEGEFDESALAVGAPIYDHTDHVIAGVSTGGPRFRVERQQVSVLGRMVIDAANGISRAMGYGGPLVGENDVNGRRSTHLP